MQHRLQFDPHDSPIESQNEFVQHAARIFNLVINTTTTNTEVEALALSEALMASISALAKHKETVVNAFEMLHVVVDGGLLMVRTAAFRKLDAVIIGHCASCTV